MRQTIRGIAAALAVCAGGGGSATAAVIVAYPSVEALGELAASEVAAGVAAMPLGRGPEILASSGGTFNSRGWPLDAVPSADAYLEWGWSASAQPWDLERLDVRYDRSASGPAELQIQLAVNGGPFQAVFLDSDVDAAGESQLGIDLSEVRGVSTAVFRLFAYRAGSATGTLDIEDFQSGPSRGIAVHGQGNAVAVPELSGWMMLLTGLGTMLLRKLQWCLGGVSTWASRPTP